MLNVLLIANQQRLQHVVAEAASLSGVALKTAADLDLSDDITAAPPAILFLQNRLSGLSAEILCRHIRSQLKDHENTTIVVLSESVTDVTDDVTIATTVTDEELQQAVVEIMTKALRSATKQDLLETEQLLVESPAVTPAAGQTEEEASFTARNLPETEDTVSLGDAEATPVEEVAQAAPLKFHEELDSLIGTPSPPPPVEAADATFPQAAKTVGELLQRPATRRMGLRWLVICAAAFVAALTLYFLTRGAPRPDLTKSAATVQSGERGISAKPETPALPAVPAVAPPAGGHASTAPPEPAQAEKSIRKTELPRFIPSQSAVKGYGDANPGWEKYLTSDFEFRVFRKGGEIKALQAIDRTGKGMSRSFFTRAILEMADVRDYRLQTKEIKGEYLIKKGTLAGNASVILYKKKDDTQLRAFVIHYQ